MMLTSGVLVGYVAGILLVGVSAIQGLPFAFSSSFLLEG